MSRKSQQPLNGIVGCDCEPEAKRKMNIRMCRHFVKEMHVSRRSYEDVLCCLHQWNEQQPNICRTTKYPFRPNIALYVIKKQSRKCGFLLMARPSTCRSRDNASSHLCRRGMYLASATMAVDTLHRPFQLLSCSLFFTYLLSRRLRHRYSQNIISLRCFYSLQVLFIFICIQQCSLNGEYSLQYIYSSARVCWAKALAEKADTKPGKTFSACKMCTRKKSTKNNGCT